MIVVNSLHVLGQSSDYSELAIPPFALPLAPEVHVAAWQRYKDESQQLGVWLVLKQRLVQLQFPIQLHISQSDAYKTATRQGVLVESHGRANGLVLERPEALTLTIHQSAAGPIPVLVAPHRADFVKLVQALTKRNEPVPIPDSMGACMVAGYNNWDRIRAYREQWAMTNPGHVSEAAWQVEFKRLIPQKQLYQDRFIILHSGPYSGVPAAEMGLEEEAWRALSLKIRLEHECTHYFTKRVFGIMRRHPFDELLADYAGIVAALGYFRADWFLRFMGLEAYPVYREGGRLQNYVAEIPHPSEAFQMVQTQLKAAAENLERFDQQLKQGHRQLGVQAWVLLAISRFTLADLAAKTAPELLLEALHLLQEQAALNDRVGG